MNPIIRKFALTALFGVSFAMCGAGIALSAGPVCASADSAVVEIISAQGTRSYDSLRSALDEWRGNQTLRLLADVETQNTINIGHAENESIRTKTLDLNGHTLRLAEKNSSGEKNVGCVLRVSGYTTHLIINDTSAEGGGAITGGYSVIGVGDGVMRGGGVYVDRQALLELCDGSITGNTANYGGGVYLDGGTFIMSGGSITGNRAVYGLLSNETTGTTIAYGGNGGGVYLHGSESGYRARFTMSGGTISDNVAENTGGGVSVWERGEFRQFASGSTRDGGHITGNEARLGGGVYVHGYIEDMAQNIASYSQEAGSVNGNVAVESTDPITGKSIPVAGGGVYIDVFGIYQIAHTANVRENAVQFGEVSATQNVYLGSLEYTLSGSSVSVYQPVVQISTNYIGEHGFTVSEDRIETSAIAENVGSRIDIGRLISDDKTMRIVRGEGEDSGKLYVVKIERESLSLTSDRANNTISVDEQSNITARITPEITYENSGDIYIKDNIFEWYINGQRQTAATGSVFLFRAGRAGKYDVRCRATIVNYGQEQVVEDTISITVTEAQSELPPEKTFTVVLSADGAFNEGMEIGEGETWHFVATVLGDGYDASSVVEWYVNDVRVSGEDKLEYRYVAQMNENDRDGGNGSSEIRIQCKVDGVNSNVISFRVHERANNTWIIYTAGIVGGAALVFAVLMFVFFGIKRRR